MSKKKYDTISISIGKKGTKFRTLFENFKKKHPEINTSELFKNIIMPVLEDMPESKQSKINFAKAELKNLYRQRNIIMTQIKKIEQSLNELGVNGHETSSKICYDIVYENLSEEQQDEVDEVFVQ